MITDALTAALKSARFVWVYGPFFIPDAKLGAYIGSVIVRRGVR